PGVGRAEPRGPTPAERHPGVRRPGRSRALAAGPERRGLGVRQGGPRSTYAAAAAAAAAARCLGLSPPGRSRLFSLRSSLARPPLRFPPARPALAPSARRRCRVNWNQSLRPASHNAQRAARHIPSLPRASGLRARAAWRSGLDPGPAPCPLTPAAVRPSTRPRPGRKVRPVTPGAPRAQSLGRARFSAREALLQGASQPLRLE
ncbi:hypothetical protein P7K49_003810, partial [Saguinus oedipus]